MSVSTPPVDISIENEGRPVWLVKIPAQLAKVWNEQQEVDLDLGTISVQPPSGRPAKRRCTVQINPALLNPDLPPSYRLEFTPDAPKIRVFSHDAMVWQEPHICRIALEGIVTDTGTLMPEQGEAYSRLLRGRLLAAMRTDRTVTSLDEQPRYTKDSKKLGQFKIEREAEEEAVPAIPAVANIRGKLTEDELKTLLFHQFEEKEFWSLKELNGLLRQPESHLKKVLKEICIYHRQGPNKSSYELKPQYKHAVTGTADGD